MNQEVDSSDEDENIILIVKKIGNFIQKDN